MGWLCRAVDDEVEGAALEQRQDRLPVADVQFHVLEAGHRLLEPSLVPASVPMGPKNTARMLLSTPTMSAPSALKYATASDPMRPLESRHQHQH